MADKEQQENQHGGNIVIIGPRNSGKTTYLAGLSYWPKLRDVLQKKSAYKVQALNQDAKKLQEKAENIILEGESLEPTNPKIPVFEIPAYLFRIEVKRRFAKPEPIDLVIKDYAGEIFDEFNLNSMKAEHREFWQECLIPDVAGCLILLSEWQRKDDRRYNQILNALTDLIDEQERTENFRLAVAISKCERGELWPGRIEPQIDIFGSHLPQTKAVLESKIPSHNLQFYALSTFGVLSRNNPRPNRIDEVGAQGEPCSVLREPNKWKPYNMIAPLYWLSTGKRIGANVK
ncbi:MAG: hypothetical protein AB4426_09990 [Xenococcaceae cyanobacterium]